MQVRPALRGLLSWALFIGLSFTSLMVFALGDLRFQRLPFTGDSANKNDNLSAVRVTVKDHRGFIWFGGENGLARYDGHEIVIYQTDADDPNSLSGNFVWALALDHDGVLWIGTGRGLSRYNPLTDDFRRIEVAGDGQSSISNNSIKALAVDRDNNLIIGTGNGLNILNADRTTFTIYRHDPEYPGSLSHDFVRSLLVDSQNRIWVGTSEGGLNRFDRETQSFTAFQHDPQQPNSLIDNDVSAIEEDHLGRFWVGTYNRGISRLNEDGQTFTHYRHQPSDPGSLGSNNISDIHEDQQHNLWVATDHGGLALYLPQTGSFRRYSHSAYDINSLSTNHPRHIYEDELGDLWIGMFPTGVNFLDHSASMFTNYFHKPDEDNSLSNNGILSFLEDSDGILWIGTENGLNAFDRQAGTFTRYYSNPQDEHALRFGSVLTVEEDITGELWVGTWSGGLHRFNKKTGQFINYFPDENDPNSLSNEFVWKVLRDSDDVIWVGTETGGLNRYNRDTDDFERFQADPNNPNSIISNQIWNMLEDSKGYLWIATLEGLDRFDKTTEGFTHYLHDPKIDSSLTSNQIISLFEDSRGRLWIGTRDAGVNILGTDGKLSSLGTHDGLPSASVSSIIEDDHGNIWLTTVNGIARIHPDSFAITTFNRTHGLSSNNFNRDATFKDKDGNLYVGGIHGFSVFDPIKVVSDSLPPPVVITGFRIFNQPVPIGGDLLPQSISETDALTLGHEHTMFSFDFAALSYRSSSSNQYAYKLEGFDQDWNMIGNQTSATYTNISPGNYVFRVKAANRDGVWNNEGASIAIEITAPPWLSWWAYLGYALVLAVVIFMTSKYKSLRIKSNLYRALSTTDPLTGIQNRTGMAQSAEQLFARKEIESGVGLLVMDIDHFKSINDIRGHDAGDRILKDFTRLIGRSVRSGDSFARWGGEEFVLLCSNINRDGAVALAEKIRTVIAEYVFEENVEPLKLTVSIGLACARPDDTYERVFKRADIALYEAKSAGRNCVRIAD